VSDTPNLNGDIAEAQVKLSLIQKDLQVFEPIRDSCRSDLVAEVGDELYRVQIKSGWYSEGKVKFNTRSVTDHDGNKYESDYVGDVDVFAVYCSEVDQVYWIPIEDTPSTKMALRVEEAKQDDSRINWAEDYLLDRKI
jgi:hypothetical protein